MDHRQELYQQTILEHNRSPRNFKKIERPTHFAEGYNPLCGDKFRLYFDLDTPDVSGQVKGGSGILNATFHGYGCAISTAAASVLMEKLVGKTVDEATAMIKTYFETLSSEGASHAESKGEFQAFAAVRQFPERRTCATLSWTAAQDFFSDTVSNFKIEGLF